MPKRKRKSEPTDSDVQSDTEYTDIQHVLTDDSKRDVQNCNSVDGVFSHSDRENVLLPQNQESDLSEANAMDKKQIVKHKKRRCSKTSTRRGREKDKERKRKYRQAQQIKGPFPTKDTSDIDIDDSDRMFTITDSNDEHENCEHFIEGDDCNVAEEEELKRIAIREARIDAYYTSKYGSSITKGSTYVIPEDNSTKQNERDLLQSKTSASECTEYMCKISSEMENLDFVKTAHKMNEITTRMRRQLWNKHCDTDNECNELKKLHFATNDYCGNNDAAVGIQNITESVMKHPIDASRKAKLNSSTLKERNYWKKRYDEDPKYKEWKKLQDRKRYRENLMYKEKKLSNSSFKYRTYRKNAMALRYRHNSQCRHKLKTVGILRYRNNILYRQQLKHASVNKYRFNIKHRRKVKNASIDKYKRNVEHRRKVRDASIDKYKSDMEHRRKVKGASVDKYKRDMEHRRKVKGASVDKYKRDMEHRKKVKGASVDKYKSDIEHRRRVRKASIDKYKTNIEHREHVDARSQLQYRHSASYRKRKQEQLQHKYQTDSTLRRKKINKVKQRRQQKDNDNNDALYFRQAVREGPKYVCCVCHKFKFKKQVLNCNVETYVKNGRQAQIMANRCITYTYSNKCTDECGENCETLNHGKIWICHTCHSNLIKGQMPADAVANSLHLQHIPNELQNLNTLEKQLLCLRLPFMKIVRLPKGGQKAVIGPCVSVPTDIQKTTKVLPRCENDSELVRVKLKRKLPYKGHYTYEFVSSAKLKKGLQYLQENNKLYSDISYDETWQPPASDTFNIGVQQQNTDDDDDDEPRSCINPVSDGYEQKQEKTTKSADCSKTGETDSENEDDDPTMQYKGLPFDTCLQPTDIGQEMLDQYFDGIFCVASGEGNTPVSMLREDGNEAMSFPVQFPDGSGTYNDNRETKLSRTRYFHSRLLNADRRFASDSQYIFYAQYLAELEQVVSKVSIALRKGTATDKYGKQITADMLTDGSSIKNLLQTDQGYKFMTPIRGTPPYWQSTLKDLFAMIRQLGIPTWFCTFSAADLRWTEVLDILMEQQGDNRSVDDLDWLQKCEVLQNNPIMNAVIFDHRFHTLLKLIIIDKEVIGKVRDHFHRIEFQQRGSPHSHCLFWIKDAPLLDQEDDGEVCSFVNKYVSCSLPPEQEDPELNEIVSSVQQHSKGHSKSCRKKGTKCRFHFPRPPSERTFISRPQSLTDPSVSDLSPEQMLNNAKQTLNTLWEVINNTDLEEISTQSLFAAAGITQEQFEEASNILTKRNSVVLERKPSDSWINQYNPTLLRCWNANMDIQYVTDAYSCVMYIISYISKAEREMGLILEDAKKEAAEGNLDAQQAMKKIGSAYFHQREVSAQEAAYRVCGLHLKESSRKVQFIPCGNDQVRMSKPLNLIQTKSKELDDEDIWMPAISDRYKARPSGSNFDEICLATFCSEYRILASSQVPKDLTKASNVYRLKNDLGFIRKRTRTEAAVVRYPRFSQKKDPELYHKSILQLFLPHRNDNQIKPTSFKTYEEFYATGSVKLSPCSKLANVKTIVESNRLLFEHNAEALDEAQELLEKVGPLEDAWAMISPESESIRLECDMEKEKLNDDEEIREIPDLESMKSNPTEQYIEMSNSILTTDEALPLLRSMNTRQKEVFYKVRQWCLDKVNGKHPEPFRLFISGGAGTGKSHLIRCLYYQANKILAPAASNPDDPVVLLTAPTGTAAFNIGGTTLHRAFKLPQHMSLSYQHLRDETLNTLRCNLQSLQILIIDEISMVGQEVMLYVHERLRQIKQCGNGLFGNICVIAVGDFYQLPPVKQKRLYDLRPKNYFGLWSLHFSFVELEEIMRQKDDRSFAELLNRLRTKGKDDQLDASDLSCLQDCQDKACDTEALHIFATNNEVETHNRSIIAKICASYQSLYAKDYDKDPRTCKLTAKQIPYPTKGDFLPSELLLGKGARVMLIRNVDITDGLVNGVVGTVYDIMPPLPGSSTPREIAVVFDNAKIGQKQRQTRPKCLPDSNVVMIKPIEETLDNNAVRHQFPLRLAWACTVHKVQGITTDKLVVSFSKIFAPGMAYVALSRVTSIHGLAIQDFDATKIYCTPQVSESLQKMTPFLQQPTDTVSNHDCIHIVLHNIQGLIPHIRDLAANNDVVPNSEFICITETWMEQDTVKPTLRHYDLHQVPRSASYKSSSEMFNKLKQQKNGGVGVFARHDADFQRLNLQVPNMEVIAFHIDNINTTIVVIYRPATYKSSAFIEHLQQLLHELPQDDTATLIIGDFNQDLLKNDKSIHNFLANCNYKQFLDTATTDGDTLIDHIYIRGNISVQTRIVPTYYSYHNMIALTLSSN